MHQTLGRHLGLLALACLVASPATAQSSIPTPESVLGARVGDDFFLATYEESMAYFHQLAAASDRVELRRIGKTSFGRDWYLAIISSAENLARLDEIQATALRLAHPEGLSDADARRMAREGKAVIHIDGGLHATEVAHAQHTI
ncbi:MAG: M14 family zinc carboxypeptidase, partial [Acidobacteriota bacterium]